MFSVSAHGSREGVIKKVQGEKPSKPDQAGPAIDPKLADLHKEECAQVERLKALIVAEINALDKKFNGCRVTAECDFNAASRTGNFNVIGQEFHL